MITITGRVISKKNNRRNYGRVSLPSEAFVRFENDALSQLKKCKEKHTGAIHIDYSFYIKGRMDTDLDNLITSVNDVLQKAGIIENDRTILGIEAVKWMGQKDFKTEIYITNLDSE